MTDQEQGWVTLGGCCLGLCGLFLALQLTGGIQWSWFWVLSPVWIPSALFVGVVLFAFGRAEWEILREDWMRRQEQERWKQRRDGVE